MTGKKKEVWIKADADAGSWAERKARITAGLESGVDAVLVDPEDVAKVRELGRIAVAAFATASEMEESVEGADILVYGKGDEGDGTVPLPSDLMESRVLAALQQVAGKRPAAGYVELRGKAYERFAVTLADFCDYVIVIGTDWKIIPLENIIAELQRKEVQVIAGVQTADEARTALETLEYGADGVLIDTADISELKRAVEIRDASTMGALPLSTARITKVKELEMGDRACVDTCSLMVRGEGMLVGSQSFALFLVHSESEESPYVAARPFRVNAGAVHAYVLVGEKTRYLSELQSGDEILIVNAAGRARKSVVGRSKIEKRPLMLVEAEVALHDGARRRCSIILQNAETIKLMGKEKPISVVDLKEGDEVLVHLTEAARHFGMAVDEQVIEK
jgi:3-dehydroquinate synthase II